LYRIVFLTGAACEFIMVLKPFAHLDSVKKAVENGFTALTVWNYFFYCF